MRLAPVLLPIAIAASFACDVSRPKRQRPAGVCPALASEEETAVHADVRCSPTFCTASISQRACGLRVSASCEPSLLEGMVEPEGEVRFDGGCIGRPETGEPFLRIECPGEDPCAIDLFHQSAPAELAAEPIAVVDRPFAAKEGSAEQLLEGFDPLTGYLGGMAIMPDRIAVSTYDSFQDLECRSSPTQIALIDRSTLTVELGPGLDCLGPLVGLGDRFLGLHGGPAITLFDDRGGILAQRALAADRYLFPIALIADGQRAHVLAGDGSKGRLFAIDLTALAVTATSAMLTGHRRAIAYGPTGELLVADRVDARVERYDPESLMMLGAVPMIFGGRMLSNDTGAMLASEDTVLVSSTGKNGGLWSTDLSAVRSTSVFFEREGVPWALANFGGHPFAGVTTRAPEYTALVSRYDLERSSFAPGATEIGRGVVRALVADGDELWALLPWSATVVRLRQR